MWFGPNESEVQFFQRVQKAGKEQKVPLAFRQGGGAWLGLVSHSGPSSVSLGLGDLEVSNNCSLTMVGNWLDSQNRPCSPESLGRSRESIQKVWTRPSPIKSKLEVKKGSSMSEGGSNTASWKGKSQSCLGLVGGVLKWLIRKTPFLPL